MYSSLSLNGQNLFFIGENSYECTETITLQANSKAGEDLHVSIVKDKTNGLFAVSTISNSGAEFNGSIIIYLDDGVVITCNDSVNIDHVDRTTKAVYSLSNEDINKMINSNINTVRYTLKCGPCLTSRSLEEGNWSASNIGTPTIKLISDFFDN